MKRIKGKLKNAEILIGEIEELDDNTLVMKHKDGSLTQLQVSDNLRVALEDCSYGDIIKLVGDGDDVLLDVLDDFPAEKNGKE